MKNAINYFYNINADKLTLIGDNYFFQYNGYNYVLMLVKDSQINEEKLYFLNSYLLQNSRYGGYDLIRNRSSSFITVINNYSYILMVDKIIENRKWGLDVIVNIDIPVMPNVFLTSADWDILWKNKVDFFERYILEKRNIYDAFSGYFDYFIGISENAITYYHDIIKIKNMSAGVKTICHKRIINNKNMNDILNPLNLICDWRARDIAEYYKMLFWNNKERQYDDSIFEAITNEFDAKLFVSRMLFPSFFFDTFEKIENNLLSKEDLILLIQKINDYERYLFNIIEKLKMKYGLIDISWLKKVDYSSTLTTPNTSGTSFTSIDSMPSFNVTSIMLQ